MEIKPKIYLITNLENMNKLLNKNIIINFSIHLIIGIIITLYIFLNWHISIENFLFKFTSINSWWLFLLFWDIDNLYYWIFYWFILKYLFVIFTIKIFYKKSEKFIIIFSFITSIIISLAWYLFIEVVASV